MTNHKQTIQRIKQKLAEQACTLNPPLSMEKIKKFEETFGVDLPEELVAFYTEVSDGLDEMYDGFKLLPLGEWDVVQEMLTLEFPFEEAWIWEDEDLDELAEQAEQMESACYGNITLLDYGSGQSFGIIVNGKERGNIWAFAEVGIQPLEPRMDFLAWFERWLDGESFFEENGENDETQSKPHQNADSDLSSVKIGDIISFSGYDWCVLDVREDTALIITENIVSRRAYNKKRVPVTWETCDLRKYLNGEFLGKVDKSRIAPQTIQNPDNLWYETTWYGTKAKGGNPTQDSVFVLSLEEVDYYFGNSGDYENKRRKKVDYPNTKEFVSADNGDYFLNIHDSKRATKLEECWWLRSPGHCGETAAFVCGDGTINVSGRPVEYDDAGVRPALWVKQGER
jgi:hypothetical protein